MYNKENTSKLISYWLRHNPSEANLVVDEFGWVSVNDLLDALRLREQELTNSDVYDLNKSFDKVRWEFDELRQRIRATHGHSIPIVINDKSAEPPKVLFHGTASRKLINIFNDGLIPMQRQFVHLSGNTEQAVEIGKRHGKPILIEIDAETLYKTGVDFYQTSNNVWLTAAIPTSYLAFEPWQMVSDDEKSSLLRQLKNEITQKHILYDKVEYLELIMRRHDCDDTLFRDRQTEHIFEVHLTWQGKQFEHPGFPVTKQYNSLADWVEESLIDDQNKMYNF